MVVVSGDGGRDLDRLRRLELQEDWLRRAAGCREEELDAEALRWALSRLRPRWMAPRWPGPANSNRP